MASTPDLLSAEGSGAEPSASAEVYCAGDLSIEVGGLLGGAFVTGEIARATMDGGHVAPILDTLWARDNLPAQVDWGYRAVHEVATAAKEIIGRFYGRPSAHSYFYGLSDGGREALMEAQRYPGDFAGIVADAPAFLSSTLNGILQPWVASANLDEHGGYILTPEKVRVLHAAVIAACDRLDGLADHLIEDPRACTFNPSTVECPGATDRADCLTHAQVEVARTLYEPPHDGAGHVLYPGAMPYGSEAAWDFEITAAPGVPAMAPSLGGFRRDFAQDVDPTSSMRSWRIDLAEMRALRERQGPIIDAADPDLRAFQARSGKLILIQGWADQAVVPMGTIAYWHAIGTTMGGNASRDAFTRLFMLPGVSHGLEVHADTHACRPAATQVRSRAVPIKGSRSAMLLASSSRSARRAAISPGFGKNHHATRSALVTAHGIGWTLPGALKIRIT